MVNEELCCRREKKETDFDSMAANKPDKRLKRESGPGSQHDKFSET